MLTNHGIMKVLDFGIAKLGDSGMTKAGVVLGTPSYLAPEQASGRRIDHRAEADRPDQINRRDQTGE